MPGLHLPRMPYDLFVYDFPYDFSGIVGGYGLRRMCLHCIRATCDFLYGPSATDRRKPYWNRALSCIPQPLHGNRTEPVRLPYGGRAQMVRWLCDYRVVLGTRVPKAYNFIFLLVLSVEMAPKTKVGKWKRSKKENVNTSQGGRTVIVRSPWGCCKITALYLCDFIGTTRAPCGNVTIAVREP